jgi:hypothetical protein
VGLGRVSIAAASEYTGVVKELILCEPLASVTRLGDARVHALAAVSAIVEGPEARQYHAAYLLGSLDPSWCLLDELLDPIGSPNGCDASFRIAPRAGSSGQPWQAAVSAQRTCYDTRDQ